MYASWLDDLVKGFNDLAENDRAWGEYQRQHPEPQGDDEHRWQAWQDAGPNLWTAAGRAIAPMSSGEVRILRLLTTLADGQRRQAGWRLDDVSFDDRGAAARRPSRTDAQRP